MYDEREIEDSLEFVEQIELYEKCKVDNIVDVMGLRDAVQGAYSGNAALEDITPEEKAGAVHDKSAGYDIFTENAEYPQYVDGASDKMYSGKDNVVKSRQRWNVADIVFIAVCIVISFAITYTFTHYVAHHTKVEGSSMNDTLSNGDYLLVEKISYYRHGPERFDIIVFPYSEDVNYIKRIIGMPGEKVQIIDGNVYINDNLLRDDIYGKEPVEDPGMAADPVYLSEDEYFVMGDNRNSSIDSRSSYVGAVKRDKIEGKAVYRFWPFSGFGGID